MPLLGRGLLELVALVRIQGTVSLQVESTADTILKLLCSGVICLRKRHSEVASARKRGNTINCSYVHGSILKALNSSQLRRPCEARGSARARESGKRERTSR